MDSDVSAEGDFDNESPRIRSRISSNSEGQQSLSPVDSLDHNTDNESSDEEKLSSSRRESSSDRESSPDVKNSDVSGKESSPELKNNALSDRDSSPNKDDVSDEESSSEIKVDRESERESSLDAQDSQSRGSSPCIKNMKSGESSPDVRNSRSRESSPNRQNSRSRESSFDVHNERSRESSLGIKSNNYSDGEMSPMKNHSRSPTVVSPENGAWPSSPQINQSPKSPSPGSFEDDYRQHLVKEEKMSPFNSESLYENANGDLSPKSPKRSGSVCSNRSSIASSLDSISPNQFGRPESNKTDDDGIGKDQEQNAENKKGIIDFADDLSDVSDIESNDSFGVEEEIKEEPKEMIVNEMENTEINDDKQLDDAVSLHVEGEEQLDFEAEEGECSPKVESKKSIKEKEEQEQDKEKEHSDLEEGELTDDNDAKPEETERPVCRFFSRGHCTWGSNCRFIHPGVMDKGNYSMFDTVRPIITPGGPPPNSSSPMMYPVFPPHMPHPHLAGERPTVIPPAGTVRKDEPAVESAWERGLRQAKEMIRKSSKRKETEVDFEDKKMNLTLSQDEIDKENDYYSRHSNSPIKSPDLAEKWKMEADAKSHRTDPYANDLPPPVPHAVNDVPPLGYYPPLHHGISRPDYWNPHRMGGLPYEDYALRAPHIPFGPDFYSAAAGRRYMHPNSYYPPRPGGVTAPPSHHPEFYDRKQKHKQYPGSSREVIVQKNDKPYKDESPTRYRNRREESPRIERARDDEWADPWMRTKSPASGRRRRRKNTYSSGSSYTSSSESSRSSSRSSFNSRLPHSRSRSKVRSSGSHSPSSSRSASESQNRKKPMQFKLSPSSRIQLSTTKKNPKSISPSLLSERRAATERAMHMNPPPPSPKIKTRLHASPNTASVGSLPISTSPARAKGGLPDRLLAHSKAAVAAAMRSARSSESRSSKSSSGSSSSDSSSESSDSSASSSSSSKSSKTPPVRAQKRIPEEHMSVSQTVKPKPMDALKVSGQKQQIKLTLKGSGGMSQSKRTGASVDNAETRKDRPQIAGKKRVAESSESGSDSDRISPAKKSVKINQKKGAPSRRDELLKQLKAVEDAIARKRSKNVIL